MNDCPLPDVDRCAMILMSAAFRAMRSRGDRSQAEAVIGSTIDPETGLVRSDADLRPVHAATRGRKLVLEAPIQPDEYALVCIRRNEPDGGRPMLKYARAIHLKAEVPDLQNPGRTNDIFLQRFPHWERARAEEEQAARQRAETSWRVYLRDVMGRDALDEDEAGAVAELTSRFERALYQFAEKGWVALEAPQPFEPFGPEGLPYHGDTSAHRKGVSDTGSIFQARWLHAGLDEAEKRCEGDPHWGRLGGFSALDGFDAEMQSRAAVNVPNRMREYQAEKQKGQ